MTQYLEDCCRFRIRALKIHAQPIWFLNFLVVNMEHEASAACRYRCLRYTQVRSWLQLISQRHHRLILTHFKLLFYMVRARLPIKCNTCVALWVEFIKVFGIKDSRNQVKYSVLTIRKSIRASDLSRERSSSMICRIQDSSTWKLKTDFTVSLASKEGQH